MTEPAIRPTTRYINVGHTFAHLLMLIFPTAVLAMEGTWGLGYAQLLPLGFAGYLLFGIGSLPAGWIADRWPSPWIMVLYYLGSGVACALTGLAQGPWSLAVGLTLTGTFASIYHPVALAWLVGAGDRPGRALGINGVYGAVGTAGAALVAGVLADLISWRAAFLVPGLVCLVVGALFTVGVARGRHGMVRAGYRRNRAQADGAEARRGLFLMLSVILFTGMIFQLAAVGMPKIFQARLGDTIGTSAIAAGTLVSVVYAISALGQVAGGMLADRYDERTLYPISYVFQIGILAVAVVDLQSAAGRGDGARRDHPDRHPADRELPDRALHARDLAGHRLRPEVRAGARPERARRAADRPDRRPYRQGRRRAARDARLQRGGARRRADAAAERPGGGRAGDPAGRVGLAAADARVIRWTEVRAKPVRTVAGLMTGTSMDGLDIALCRVTSAPGLGFDLLAFETVPLPAGLRAALAAEHLHDLAGLARTDAALGRFFADALAGLLERHPVALDLIGSHGQTVYHEHGLTSLQLGEPAHLAWRFRCPVVHDFRANDIAAGGAGAPLVPYVDYRLLGGRGAALLMVNIGGIANFTALPAVGDDPGAVLGMDCGPGNMLLDQLAQRFSRGRMGVDLDGRLAARGKVSPELLADLCAHPFFAAAPPKSAGREQFGAAFAETLLAKARPGSDQDWYDLLATATELTAFGIHDCYLRHVARRLPVESVVISGGGARNPELMARLAARFGNLPLATSDAYGLPVDAKEAIAFAILASERIDERPTNLPSVTGASAQVLLGKVTEC